MLFYVLLLFLLSFTSAASENYERLTKALQKEAETVKDDYCYACLKAAALVGLNLPEFVRKNLEKSKDEDWYPYLDLAYEDLVCFAEKRLFDYPHLLKLACSLAWLT